MDGNAAVDGSRGVGGSRGGIGNSLALVPDVSDVTGVGVTDGVGHNLGSAVGELDAVFAVGGVSVSVLVVAEIGTSGVAVSLHSVSELVCWGIDVFGLTISGGRAVSGGRGINWSWSIRSWGVGSWHNPVQRSVGMGMGVGSVSRDSGHKTEESNKSLK
jgi:hypothetical protein